MKKYRVLTITTPAVAKKLIKLQEQLLDILPYFREKGDRGSGVFSYVKEAERVREFIDMYCEMVSRELDKEEIPWNTDED